MPILLTNDSVSITNGTEYFLAADSTTASYQTTDAILQVWLHFPSLVAGESFAVKVYERVNGLPSPPTNPVYHIVVEGAQSGPTVTPSLLVGDGWEVSITRIAGANQTVHWSLRTIS